MGRADGSRGFVIACVPPFGSMAERTLVAGDAILPLPDGLDDGTAVAMGTTGLAAWVPLTPTSLSATCKRPVRSTSSSTSSTVAIS